MSVSGQHTTTSSSPSPQPNSSAVQLKYISLLTLALQNALLSIVMHYSRVSTAPSKTYSAALAVLLNELLKGSISFGIAIHNIDRSKSSSEFRSQPLYSSNTFLSKCRKVVREVFSTDCWKLSIPAILYVIQNNLQFVASSNLDIATFQVTYQMKILTTAAFSVLLLRKKLSTSKWFALLALAIGVGIVQIQARVADTPSASSSTNTHHMNPFKGFLAVSAACFTSGLAGVYFEMVLKNSQADLWVRNVQLSLFSILPAIAPILNETPISGSWFQDLFRNFGFWAWATVSIQVFGGLVTAVVIKYSDNILKGFATSLSILISFLASVALFNFHITPGFILGAVTVLVATWLYNQPSTKETTAIPGTASNAANSSPIEPDAPIIGHYAPKRRFSPWPSVQAGLRVVGASFGFSTRSDSEQVSNGHARAWADPKSPVGYQPISPATPSPNNAIELTAKSDSDR